MLLKQTFLPMGRNLLDLGSANQLVQDLYFNILEKIDKCKALKVINIWLVTIFFPENTSF